MLGMLRKNDVPVRVDSYDQNGHDLDLMWFLWKKQMKHVLVFEPLFVVLIELRLILVFHFRRIVHL